MKLRIKINLINLHAFKKINNLMRSHQKEYLIKVPLLGLEDYLSNRIPL